MNIYIHEKTRHISQTRTRQGPLLSPVNWAQCCYCIHQWKRPTFSSHQYRTNIVATPPPLFHVKGAVLKVDGAVDLGSVSNEIFNEPMFCAVGQLLATLLGFVEGHLGWMSPFSCIVEEYHDNVAWCHSGRNSLKQGAYCSKMRQGGVEYSDCAMDSMENRMITSPYWKRIRLLWCLQLPTHWKYFFITFANSFCMCSQILADSLTLLNVFVSIRCTLSQIIRTVIICNISLENNV